MGADRPAIRDGESALAYLLALLDSDIDLQAAREVAPGLDWNVGHHAGVEETLHRYRREVRHLLAVADAVARGVLVPISGDQVTL